MIATIIASGIILVIAVFINRDTGTRTEEEVEELKQRVDDLEDKD